MRKIKIAQVIGPAVNGGTESFAMNYFENMDHNKIQFDFLVESTSKIIDKKKIEAMGGRVIEIPSYKRPIKYVRTLKKIFSVNKYDIVHSNMNSLSILPLKAAKKAGIPVRIAHSHSMSGKGEFVRNLIKVILKQFSKKYATHYFACSKMAGKWLFGKKTMDLGLVEIIYNAFDVEKYKYNEKIRLKIRKKYNLEDKYVIGNIGRFVKQKNQLFVIKIFNKYLMQNPNAVLLLLGDGPLKERLIMQCRAYGIEENVLFLEPKSFVGEIYQAIDLFLFPSIYEGLGMTFVEAQISGLQCIGSNVIPHEAIITDNCLLLPLDLKEDKWAGEIKKIMPFDRRKFNDCYVNEQYDIHIQAKRLYSIYCKLIDDNKRGC